jgi:hypothetical protein
VPNFEHADPVAERQSDDASDADLVAWLGDALAVDADVAGLDDRRGKRAALNQANAV